jgi:spore coat protein U-like protein
MRVSSCALAWGFLAFGLASRPAVAAIVTTTFGVTATVQAACLISISPTAFKTGNGATAASGPAVSVACTNSAPYNVGLSAELATAVTETARKATGPASVPPNHLIFRDSAGAHNGANTVATDIRISKAGGTAMQSGARGQIGAGNSLASDSPADTMLVTVTF